jgi:hypothetical protein
MPAEVCAILYDESNCKEGIHALTKSPLHLQEGELDLATTDHNRDAESVKVNKGCAFRGYVRDFEGAGFQETAGLLKKAEEIIEGKGDFVVVVAPENEPKWANLEGDLKKALTSVSCHCGNKADCPAVPPYLCAVAYEKVACEVGEFPHPLEIPVTDKLNLGLITHFAFHNNIESVSVRKGCTFKGFKDTDLNAKDGEVTVTAAGSPADVHLDLKEPKELPNAIESLSCTCA